MKKFLLIILTTLSISQGFSQYFEASITNTDNYLIFNIRPKPGGGNIVINAGAEFQNIEFCVRYPTSSPSFTWGTPVTGADFPGATFAFKGNDEYGTYPNKVIARFQWQTNGITFVPSSGLPKTYTDGQSYEVFRVPLVGTPPATVDLELTANTVTYSPSYIAITDRNNTALDISAAGTGDAFYGTGFYTDPAGDQFIPLNDVPLPVKFSSFNAVKKDGNALLTWLVENENVTSTASYEVQRSLNGVDFTTITTLLPSANGSDSKTYNTKDDLGTLTGIVYYRIKQFDKDGRFVYSEIKSVRITGEGTIMKVFPNPVKTTTLLTIDLTQKSPISVKITDAGGKELRTIQFQGNTGSNFKTIDLSSFNTGTYLLKVAVGSTENKIISLVKTK